MKTQIQNLINELDHLKTLAEVRSRTIVEDGQEVPDEHRAKSAGYADAYSFCIFRLKEILFGKPGFWV